MRGPETTRRTLLSLLAAGAVLPRHLLAATGQQAQPSFTLSNATLLLHTGERIEGAGVRVVDGRIAELGKSVKGGTDLAGAWLVPGLCDAGCRLGLVEIGMEKDTHDATAGENVAPDARAVDGYNPRSELIPIARINGVTTVVVHPSLSGLIAGQAALMRTDGDTLFSATIDPGIGMCVQVGRAGQGGDEGPKTRVGVSMKLRKVLDEIELPEDKGKKKKGNSDEDISPADQALRAFKRGELRALIKVERADDIERVLDVIANESLNAALVGCAEGHLLAREIADADVPVIVGPLDVQPNSFQHRFARYENAALLHEAGVKLAFRTGSAHGVRALPTLAGLAVAHGLPFEAAIRALTVQPMEMFGRDDLGRLAEGAEATFFSVAGDPLQPRHPVHQVWIQGRATSMRTRQTQLYEDFKVLR